MRSFLEFGRRLTSPRWRQLLCVGSTWIIHLKHPGDLTWFFMWKSHMRYTPVKFRGSEVAKWRSRGGLDSSERTVQCECGALEKSLKNKARPSHARPRWRNQLFSLWHWNISRQKWINGEDTQRRTMSDSALIPVQSTPGATGDSHPTDQRPLTLTGWSQSALTQRKITGMSQRDRALHWNKVWAPAASPAQPCLTDPLQAAGVFNSQQLYYSRLCVCVDLCVLFCRSCTHNNFNMDKKSTQFIKKYICST